MAKRRASRDPTNQFESDRYSGFRTWQKIFFWIGVLSFASLVYWIVRLVLYLVLKEKPLRERVDAYALQTLIFGVITAIAILLAVIIAMMIVLFLIPVFVTVAA